MNRLTRLRLFALAVGVVLTLPAMSAAQPRSATERTLTAQTIGRLDALAAAEFRKDAIGSLSIGVVLGSALVWTKSYGVLDMETQKPAGPDSLYRIGSITKQITGLMLLQLMEQGKVRLSDPLEKFVPEIRQIAPLAPGQPPITLLQVATMMAGLAREPSGPPDHLVGGVAVWEQKVLSCLPFVRYTHEPGTRYAYSNIGYAILGLGLGRAAGTPFTTYVTERILTPLGMSRTTFEVTDGLRPNLARGYTVVNGKGDPARGDAEQAGRGYKVPNGGLFSSVRDLSKFLAFQMTGGAPEVLRSETQAFQHSGVFSGGAGLSLGYGLGFQVLRRGTLVLFGHFGATPGYVSAAIVDQETKSGIVLLSSAREGSLDANELAMRLLEIVAESQAAGRGHLATNPVRHLSSHVSPATIGRADFIRRQ